MKRLRTIFTSALTVAWVGGYSGTASAQVVSLDDDPSFPIAGPVTPPHRSAEDPYGLGLPPVAAGFVGPSPSLILGPPWSDADFFTFGLAWDTGIVPLSYVDSVSANHVTHTPGTIPQVTIKFSVDRQTSGVGALGVEAGFNQAPGDIFISTAAFPHPGIYVGTPGPAPFAGVLPPAGTGGGNALFIDESAFGLTPGFGPGTTVGPGVPAPPITPGSHDNVDAYNDWPAPSLVGAIIYYTVAPAEAVMLGVSPADIFGSPASPPPHVHTGGLFAGAPAMGLDLMGGRDDIDALIVWNNTGGPAVAGRDYALFSLSPGSPTLMALMPGNPAINPATIFFTDFSGKFWVYLYSPDLGITMGIDFPCLNVDALEIGTC